MQLVFEEGLAQCLLHLTLASLSALPTGKAHQAHNLIDVRNHSLDQDRRFGCFYFVEQFGQSSLATILVLFGWNFFFGLQGFLGNLQQLL